MARKQGLTHYLMYNKTAKGWKVAGSSQYFRTAQALKDYWTRTSSVRVKFIRVK